MAKVLHILDPTDLDSEDDYDDGGRLNPESLVDKIRNAGETLPADQAESILMEALQMGLDIERGGMSISDTALLVQVIEKRVRELSEMSSANLKSLLSIHRVLAPRKTPRHQPAAEPVPFTTEI